MKYLYPVCAFVLFYTSFFSQSFAQGDSYVQVPFVQAFTEGQNENQAGDSDNNFTIVFDNGDNPLSYDPLSSDDPIQNDDEGSMDSYDLDYSNDPKLYFLCPGCDQYHPFDISFLKNSPEDRQYFYRDTTGDAWENIQVDLDALKRGTEKYKMTKGEISQGEGLYGDAWFYAQAGTNPIKNLIPLLSKSTQKEKDFVSQLVGLINSKVVFNSGHYETHKYRNQKNTGTPLRADMQYRSETDSMTKAILDAKRLSGGTIKVRGYKVLKEERVTKYWENENGVKEKRIQAPLDVVDVVLEFFIGYTQSGKRFVSIVDCKIKVSKNIAELNEALEIIRVGKKIKHTGRSSSAG